MASSSPPASSPLSSVCVDDVAQLIQATQNACRTLHELGASGKEGAAQRAAVRTGMRVLEQARELAEYMLLRQERQASDDNHKGSQAEEPIRMTGIAFKWFTRLHTEALAVAEAAGRLLLHGDESSSSTSASGGESKASGAQEQTQEQSKVQEQQQQQSAAGAAPLQGLYRQQAERQDALVVASCTAAGGCWYTGSVPDGHTQYSWYGTAAETFAAVPGTANPTVVQFIKQHNLGDTEQAR